MIYIIKFFYLWLLPPGIFVLLLLLAGLWVSIRWKHRKEAVMFLIMALLLYLCASPFLSYFLLHPLESRYSVPGNVKGDVIVMLGQGSVADVQDIDGMGLLSGAAANHLLTAARLSRKLDIPIILSGGQVFQDTGNESQIARRQLIQLGISSVEIMMDDKSRNTVENAKNTAEILKSKGFKHPILVTSAYHMERAVMDFKRFGITVLPYPTDYLTSGHFDVSIPEIVPSVDYLRDTEIALQQYLGIVALKLHLQ